MDPIRQKLSSLLTEAAYDQIETLNSQSPCAKQLNEIKNLDTVIAEEIKKICEAATLGEITRILFLTARLNKTSGQKRETIKNGIKKIAGKVITRIEAESDPLKLPRSCLHSLWGI